MARLLALPSVARLSASATNHYTNAFHIMRIVIQPSAKILVNGRRRTWCRRPPGGIRGLRAWAGPHIVNRPVMKWRRTHSQHDRFFRSCCCLSGSTCSILGAMVLVGGVLILMNRTKNRFHVGGWDYAAILRLVSPTWDTTE